MRMRLLPLGIDIGATRVRVVEACVTPAGPRLRAVAVRERSIGTVPAGAQDLDYLSALIEDAARELRTKQRRCVCALGEPDALIRSVRFPKMTGLERQRAARYEAQRYADFSIDDAVVRVQSLDRSTQLWAVGVARTTSLNERLRTLRKAGMKPIAVDHESCALGRALPGFDAIVDIGHHRSSVHLVDGRTPLTLQAYSGGADVTRAIERELSIDARTAEKRKRIIGTAGAGASAKAALVQDIAVLVANARATHRVTRIALVGNGARLAGLAEDIESATGAVVEIPVSGALHGGGYPDDVARSGAPDWTLAGGLALWCRP